MEAIRDVLRGTLAQSLRGIGNEDRLAAAWTVACGSAMAERGRVAGYEAGIVRIEVADAIWLRQMVSLRSVLERELKKIAGLPVAGIEFALEKKPGTDPDRVYHFKNQKEDLSMADVGNVTEQDVLRVAELANLDLTVDEVPRMQRDLNAILGHIAQLNELDTKGVPAMAQVGEMLGAEPERTGATLRADELRPSLDRKAVMAAAPETDGRFFKVPKVIER